MSPRKAIVIICFLLLSHWTLAEPSLFLPSPKEETPQVNFEDEEAYIDIEDAKRSRSFMHRSILASVVKDTSRFSLGRFFVSHVMGFNMVKHLPRPETAIDVQWIEYSAGIQGISAGYLMKNKIGADIGLQFSTPTNLYLSLKYYFASDRGSLWPYFGIGGGIQIPSLNLADGPFEAQIYRGTPYLFFLNGGFFIPLVDVGIRAEVQVGSYGIDRLVVSSIIGLTLFF